MIDYTNGRIVGVHEGLWQFTIGQNARLRGMAEKMFVVRKDPSQNAIYVVPGS